MRAFDPSIPIGDWTRDQLLLELDVALRELAFVRDFPTGPLACAAVARVRRAHAEIARREVDLATSLRDWSESTGWRMDECLRDALDHPKSIPYVRRSNGVRIAFECWCCTEGEHAAVTRTRLCRACLQRVVALVRERTPSETFLIYRTYSPEFRCEHANDETVLALGGWEPPTPGWCERCLLDDLREFAA